MDKAKSYMTIAQATAAARKRSLFAYLNFKNTQYEVWQGTYGIRCGPAHAMDAFRAGKLVAAYAEGYICD